jgi:rhodanese-related sulfurtransferase
MVKLLFAASAIAALWTTTAVARDLDEAAVPKQKRTSLGLYITAEGAYEAWKQDPAIKIIDVRTPEEFRTIGYPKMAAKVPLSQAADEFVGRVRKIAKPDETILVICRSGNRSVAAVEMLARAGFKKAYTVVDGFEGDRNRDESSPDYGKRTVNGWKNAGLPWTKG